MITTGQTNGSTSQVRNKYNTLTPAEAKKLNRSLFMGASSNLPSISKSATGQQHPYLYSTLRHAPVRTASVLHKPRAPPIVVTDLDTTIDQLDGARLGNHQVGQTSTNGSPSSDSHRTSLRRTASIRSASLCPTGGQYDSRRQTVNYGRNGSNIASSRTSLYSAASSSTTNQRQSIIYDHHQQQQHQHQHQHQTSLDESISNLSFKSTLDTPDFAFYDPCRLQTVSVDLGSHYNNIGSGNSHIRRTPGKRPYHDPMLRGQTIARIKYNTLNNASNKVFSDESYSSTQSVISTSTLRPTNQSDTPTKFNGSSLAVSSNINHSSKQIAPRSVGKSSSLSSSTYRVFQSPFANFKKLFRNMPRPFSSAAADEPGSKFEPNFDNVPNGFEESATQYQDKSIGGDLSISDSISQISLNKSQSPPVCPPPPGELKSMCYMESAINYSNYDEFTRSRNERMAQRQQTFKDNLNTTSATSNQVDDQQSINSQDSDAWQLNSLPVYYERNLTTVFEEKQASGQRGGKVASQATSCWDVDNETDQQQRQQNMIRPPIHFEDSGGGGGGDTTLTNDNINRMRLQKQQIVASGSMQSLNSCLTTGSSQQQQQAPATPYRFSFAQPLQPPQEPCLDQVSFQKNHGLPPRMPSSAATDHHRLSINTSETASSSNRNDNSSSGNSSNCSSRLNGINNCDRPNSLDASDKTSYNSNEDSLTTSTNNTGLACNTVGGGGGYVSLCALADNEADLTLLSETSTLQGDTGIAYYANKCSELERTVTTLKNKLVGKEKELTDLQLNQLNNDYTIERLKKRLGALERENGSLKAIVGSKS